MDKGVSESGNQGCNPDFYSKSEYFDELNRRLQLAGPNSRVLLTTMTFDPSKPRIAEVMSNLEQAASRGADIIFGIDAYSFMADGLPMGPLLVHSTLPVFLSEPYKLKMDWLNKLNSHQNTRAIILHKPIHRYSLWIAGRSHIKAAVIDDYTFVGGANLDEPDDLDLMAGIADNVFANRIYTFLGPVMQARNTSQALRRNDKTLDINATTQILIDAGIRDQSTILDAGLRLIDSAHKWLVITCQFFPNARTAQHLLNARKRNVDVKIFFSPPSKHGLIGGLGQHGSVLLEKSRLPPDMFANQLPGKLPKLHAKIIACDQGMIIGSHNFVEAGVKLGTAELALQLHDGIIAKVAADKIRTIIQLAHT